jgi:hypothetical protein
MYQRPRFLAMSAPLAPHELTPRFETGSTFQWYWHYLLVGGAAVAWAAYNVPDMWNGVNAPYPLNRFIVATSFAAVMFGIAAVSNWRRLKWVRVTEDGGIQWSAEGRVWHRDWDQLVRIDFESRYSGRSNKRTGAGDQIMTATFEDGAQLRVKSWHSTEVSAGSRKPSVGYFDLRDYLESKKGQARAKRRPKRREDAQTRTERRANTRMTAFGPLHIDRWGVGWDGIYFRWKQVAGYEVEHGVLLIRTIDGHEFLRRTADLGDWQTALARLEAATEEMAGQQEGTS